MKSAKLASFYPDLGPEERFRLFLSAAARQDESEVRRLAGTCPQLLYRMRDVAYTERCSRSREVAVQWSLVWQELFRRQLAFLGPSEGLLSEDGVSTALLYTNLQLAGAYFGLARFCGRHGIELSDLINAWIAWLAPILREGPVADMLKDLEEQLPERYEEVLERQAEEITTWLEKIWGLPAPARR